MQIPSSFPDRLRAHISMPSVARQNVKLIRSGRDWKGCCPFHHEKTPSFYVYDDHYHCFGCGAHGDIISYVMEIYHLSFPDAVVSLAKQAGLSVPREKTTPQENLKRRQLREEKDQSYKLLHAAASWYHKALYNPNGKKALEYLYERGLTDETIQKFSLGWAPEDSDGLKRYLSEQHFTSQQMHEVGLLKQAPYNGRDRAWFFGRIMFPITDSSGRVISFGGRSLKDAQPKYLNGPETKLFSKRNVLFNFSAAWEAVKKARGERRQCDIIVVEGYLDVIALAQAGFQQSVAPLGTALTEEQLKHIWRISRDPLVCFDGDNAGRNAVIRSAKLALGQLDCERSIRFCLLPDGDDPDSFLKKNGASALTSYLADSYPLSEIVFKLLSGRIDPNVPQQRARLRRELQDLARLIPDKILASEYRKAFLDRFFEVYHPSKRRKTDRTFVGGNFPSAAPRGGDKWVEKNVAHERQRQMFLILYTYPPLVEEVEEALERQSFDEGFCPFRDMLLDMAASGELPENSKEFSHWLKASHQEVLASCLEPLTSQSFYENLSVEELKKRWWDLYNVMNRQSLMDELQREITFFLESDGQDMQEWERFKERMITLKKLQADSVKN